MLWVCSLPACHHRVLLECSETIRRGLVLIVNILIMSSVSTGFSGGFNHFEFILKMPFSFLVTCSQCPLHLCPDSVLPSPSVLQDGRGLVWGKGCFFFFFFFALPSQWFHKNYFCFKQKSLLATRAGNIRSFERSDFLREIIGKVIWGFIGCSVSPLIQPYHPVSHLHSLLSFKLWNGSVKFGPVDSRCSVWPGAGTLRQD